MTFAPLARSQAGPQPGPALLQRQCARCGEPACEQCAADEVQEEGVVPEIVNRVLRTNGDPLDPRARGPLERHFGRDFSHVRVHTDGVAANSADAVGASAWTVGRDLAFARGAYRPNTPGGMRLLAHELAHVVQQGGHRYDGRAPIALGAEGSAAEHEADRAANLADRFAGNLTGSGLVLQRAAAEKGAVPCLADAYRVDTRSVDLQPVFFKSNAKDAAPTGGIFATLLAKANTIWGKLAVEFKAAGAVTLEDATNKTAGTTKAEIVTVMGLHSGAGVEVFFVDNDIAILGGAATAPALGKMVVSNRATSDTLLAHELGHILGLGHPPADADANTVMQGTGSKDIANSERNTIGNYNRITWPAGAALTCIKPDA